jgi:hypothetical protein
MNANPNDHPNVRNFEANVDVVRRWLRQFPRLVDPRATKRTKGERLWAEFCEFEPAHDDVTYDQFMEALRRSGMASRADDYVRIVSREVRLRILNGETTRRELTADQLLADQKGKDFKD